MFYSTDIYIMPIVLITSNKWRDCWKENSIINKGNFSTEWRTVERKDKRSTLDWYFSVKIVSNSPSLEGNNPSIRWYKTIGYMKDLDLRFWRMYCTASPFVSPTSHLGFKIKVWVPFTKRRNCQICWHKERSQMI